MTVHPLAQEKVQSEEAKKLLELIKDKPQEFQEKVLYTVLGMTLMMDRKGA